MVTPRLFYFFIIIISAFGLTEKSKAVNNSFRTVISGQVKNLNVYPTVKVISVKIIDFRGKKTIISDSLKSDGSFKIQFDLFIAQDIEIEPFVGKIIAHKGDNIRLDIDFKDIGNIKISGDAQQTNQQLYKYLRSNFSVGEFRMNKSDIRDFLSYKLYCDSVLKILENKRIEYIKETKPTNEVLMWASDFIKIKYFEALMYYPFAIANNSQQNTRYFLPTDYYACLANIGNVFNQVLMNTNAYKLLGPYMVIIHNKILNDNPSINFAKENHALNKQVEALLMKEILESKYSDIFKQMLIADYNYNLLNMNFVELFENNRPFISANIKESFIRIPLENYFQNLKRDFKNPKIASDLILKKISDTQSKDIMDSILMSHKGKVIYMDFWATWCGPCKAEMPYSKKLIKKFAGKDVAFVFVCLDSNEKNWKLDLTQLQLSGSHYFCNPVQSSGIRKGFGIEGIPCYVLINKQGQIIESGSYLRPGNSSTVEKIEKLLIGN
jgi:thiol-disulfide isomerase/thioredoxin